MDIVKPALGSHVNSLIPGLTAKGKIVKGTDSAAEIQQQVRLAPQTPSYSCLAVTFGATIFKHKGQRYRHSTLQVLLLNPFLWGSSPQAWQAKWMLERQMLFLKPLVRWLWRFCGRLRSEVGLSALPITWLSHDWAPAQ